jgi:hypothetical protein
MKKRINFTGRKRIAAENVQVRITDAGTGQPPHFAVNLNLPAGLPGDARVYVEPYHRSSSMRFSFGTVASPKIPENLSLTELDRSASILFRLKVVDETGEIGKIIASANRIRAIEGNDEPNRKALLPLVSTDLGEDVWGIAMDGGPPVLQINNRIPSFRDRLMADPVLQGAIYPHALRTVLKELLGTDEHDDETEWVRDWKTFAGRLLGEELPENLADEDNELASTIDRIVERFCQIRLFASTARRQQEEAHHD